MKRAYNIARSMVHCRIGSLEICASDTLRLYIVHCRIGSLESKPIWRVNICLVHCRIGSLENYDRLVTSIMYVHCRIGSLERMHHFLHTSDYGLASFHPFLQNNILIHLLNYIFLLGLNHNL